ncbi:FGGY-family carbohydrate kinase [Bradyrhizobium sp. 180]|uniref:FGGY-family carbohydrate kinase n=1 Tax=unclassified Bradyrhizobium TaxID=2631580 RepID=UPI001FF7062A|nr:MULTISPECIES: FGGY-family carbohydrate kinase [unclassified Bradyrhizobium]MCK1494246.1 FGGY-family carbohydrate kinase [Bradyrhizobium sp. 180]MCK1594871.1 FGGY-family carbohydrate kinase [Bradyrhizobium sp. 164]MCK1615763.1 FGGY-family carbohydrate kinase [Bradyrhizobium sp. 159]MCK1664031.1 FGGY-family carbohydrate kinase [Bradyrhizobium sp. 153]MCK1756060.1 FGGY-family carbohydrate kinase [Bradyrhizobium sp. 137]
MPRAYIGVDVGTTSTRAGVFDEAGTLLALARHPIRTWHEAGDIVEQSSQDIWDACATSVRAAMTEAGITPDSVRGIGFDATCSLVVLDRQGEPLTVSGSGDKQRNVIVWMDHRATAEARLINETEDAVLRYVGGSISPEMQMPKLLWLKRHLRASFDAAGYFFDLADYLAWRATGSLQRSTCTVTCKWNYLAHDGGWSAPFFKRIGLSDFVSETCARIGTEMVAPGTRLGAGLTPAAAAELGLSPGTPVGASLIDAHAGGIGAIGGRDGSGGAADACDRLAYIMGTSACIMATTKEPCFVPGVWGPYYSGMVPDLWLNEGGQSAAGAAIDHLLKSHPGFGEASAAARNERLDLIDFLERRIIARAGDASRAALLARDVHVLPEFIGNRSPYADPDTRAVIAGLDLDTDIASMERLFVAGLCGLAYGLAEVIEAFAAHGVRSSIMIMGGGASRSPLVRQIMADTTGLTVALPQTKEPVLLGAAMLGAVAGGAYASIGETMAKMSALGRKSEPTAPDMAAFHARKREVYKLLRNVDRGSRAAMSDIARG